MSSEAEPVSNTALSPVENSLLYQALKYYRYKQSIIEHNKPYFIFTNVQLEDIIKTN